jgi:excisionase family DNA binding protein
MISAEPQHDSNNGQLFSVKDAARFLGISTVTMWRNLKRGTIGCYRIGSRVLLSKEEHLLPFLRQCEQKPHEEV